MDIQIVTIFYLCDKRLEALNSKPHPQTQMSDAEVMTTGIVAALFFGANLQTTCDFLKTHGYIPKMLSKSRFNRCSPTLFKILGRSYVQLNQQKIYALDTIPIAVCSAFVGQKSTPIRHIEAIKRPNVGISMA